MKYFPVLLFVLFASCQSTDKETFAFLNKGVERCNENIHSYSHRYYASINAGTQRFPRANKPIKRKTDSIKEFSNKIFSLIDSIKHIIIEQNDTIGNKAYLFDSHNSSKANLKNLLDKYNQLIEHFNNKDSMLYKSDLNITYPIESNDIVTSYLALNKLLNNVRFIDEEMLRFYNGQIVYDDFHFRTVFPIVIPKNRYVKYGDIYEAKVYLAGIDTSIQMKAHIESETYLSENGIISFQLMPQYIGKHKPKATLEIIYPANGRSLIYPLNIKCNVIRKR